MTELRILSISLKKLFPWSREAKTILTYLPDPVRQEQTLCREGTQLTHHLGEHRPSPLVSAHAVVRVVVVAAVVLRPALLEPEAFELKDRAVLPVPEHRSCRIYSWGGQPMSFPPP